MLLKVEDILESPALTYAVLGAAVKSWILAIGVWIAVTLFLVVVLRLVPKRLLALSARTETRVDDALAEALDRTATWCLVAVGAYAALPILGVDLEGAAWIRGIMFVLLLLQCVRRGRTMIRSWVRSYTGTRLATDAEAVTSVRAMGFLLVLGLWVTAGLLASPTSGSTSRRSWRGSASAASPWPSRCRASSGTSSPPFPSSPTSRS